MQAKKQLKKAKKATYTNLLNFDIGCKTAPQLILCHRLHKLTRIFF